MADQRDDQRYAPGHFPFPYAGCKAEAMIDERHQSKGYGKAAMRTILHDIKERDPDVQGVLLHYVPDNDAARKLYASVGFRETGEVWGDEVAAQYDYPGAHNGVEG